MTLTEQPPTIAEQNMRSALVDAHDRRKAAIKEVGDIQRQAADFHASERNRAKDLHRQVNRDLVAMIREARDFGMKLREIVEVLGMSPQTILQLERQVKKWDEGEEN